ncbi:hypothetical protein DFH06DRAFT_1325210 [Mycena polygramma]|nr:hypothetical protein DFH06DRAFT_1142429 [Mycena polygramma]KAJ7661885.1 hypothetical protein DFH06DRAFT_1325210 [Mycena polygramma]
MTAVNGFTLTPWLSPPILWDNDFKNILAGELDLVRHRERTEAYYRGESWDRPSFLDHAEEDSNVSLDVGSDSDTIAAHSDDETTDYVEGDAPVHARPRLRWSSNFMDEFSPFGYLENLPRYRTPSPPPPPQTEPLTHVYTRAELEHHNFEAHLEWEGPTPLVDRRGRIIGVLVDSPYQKADWNRVVADATLAIDAAKTHVNFGDLPLHGNTPNSLRAGMEYYGWGPSSAQVQNVRHQDGDNRVELAFLRHHKAFADISAWQNVVHDKFAPRLRQYVQETKDALLTNDAALLDCTGGAFPAAEFFLGSDESPPRMDDLDMPWGWRALTSLGEYNARWGGELVLWEEKKVVRFPPGATFLFPAAFMRYSFTQLRAGETQYAFSQYAQAGLFRYVENGFMSEDNFEATAWRAQREERDKLRDTRMFRALGMYSHINEIYE